uniref:tRNA (guanine(9)-N(1))-methyltransferase n=1 Tax=Amblyomma triste TaxID=251400 RepID=A0A023GKN4_AMBTT
METGMDERTTTVNDCLDCEAGSVIEPSAIVNGDGSGSSKKEFNSMTIAELEAVLNDPHSTVSKRYRKRVLRRIEWLKRRPERRALEKEKKKRKREESKAANGEAILYKRPKFTKMEESSCRIRVAIDLSLDGHMTDKEKVKCRKQIQRCYSLNRRSPAPIQLYLTGMAGSFRSGSSNMHGFEKWDVHTSDADHLSCFRKEDVVYLSSESENELQELEEDKAYIIGGLVDHNRNKGLCHRLAEEQGVKHARLPIGNCLVMRTRQVLTIDQVFAILLKVTEGKSWTEALLTVIPQRKGAKALVHESESSSSNNSDCDEPEDT